MNILKGEPRLIEFAEKKKKNNPITLKLDIRNDLLTAFKFT